MVNFITFSKKYLVDLKMMVPLAVASIILLFDALIFRGQPANMDGEVHITNIAIFYQSLIEGDFPVRWTDGFARYGLPIGNFAQQSTSYLGAFFTFFTHDVIASFNWVYVVGTVVSVLLFYLFLRIYVSPMYALIGAFLFNFAPYRIINMYIRGSLPEYFSSVFVVAILLAAYYLIKKKQSWSYWLMVLSVFGLALTHPMNAVTGSFIIVPYILFLLWREKSWLKMAALVASAFGLGGLLSGYYLVPLYKEIEYTNYMRGNYYNPSGHLYWENFFSPWWYYSLPARDEILSRGHFIKVGLLESLVMMAGVVIFTWRRVQKMKLDIFDFSVVVGLLTIAFTLEPAGIFYQKIDVLSNIQFPWRLLSTFIFIPPILVAYLLQKYKLLWVGLVLMVLIAAARFPQLYGKNITDYPQSKYYLTLDNLHTSKMNTLWMGQVTEYPLQEQQTAIVEGQGKLENLLVKNSLRNFKLLADSEVRLVDYTFYFPGWHVYVDGVEQEIIYQDPAYRGVITYKVPAGEHEVSVVYENTKTVLLGNLVSIAGWVVFAGLWLVNKKFDLLPTWFFHSKRSKSHTILTKN